jgi:hypothetical protein
MSTRELIDAALAAKADFDNAQSAMSQAATALQTAQAALVSCNQALHDDLAANGPFADVDTSATPITVTLYTAEDPDTWNATPIRAA